jgi:hypothetical protein
MAQDANYLTADKVLNDRIAAAKTPDELRSILAEAVEDAHIAHRDPLTGQFVRSEQAAPVAAAAAAAAEPKVFEKKGVVIAGTSFDFKAGSAAELDRQIADANRIAKAFAESHPVTTSRAAIARNAEQEAMDRVDADLALRRGEISPAEYLERTHAIEDYLAAQGVDVAQISSEQLEQSWAQASEVFRNSPAGADWPGGTKNQELIGLEITAMDAINAQDKVAALGAAYARLKSKGMLFESDHTPEEMKALTDKMSPVEILESWKAAQNVQHGDATAANEEFIRIHQGGSGLFDR